MKDFKHAFTHNFLFASTSSPQFRYSFCVGSCLFIRSALKYFVQYYIVRQNYSLINEVSSLGTFCRLPISQKLKYFALPWQLQQIFRSVTLDIIGGLVGLWSDKSSLVVWWLKTVPFIMNVAVLVVQCLKCLVRISETTFVRPRSVSISCWEILDFVFFGYTCHNDLQPSRSFVVVVKRLKLFLVRMFQNNFSTVNIAFIRWWNRSSLVEMSIIKPCTVCRSLRN